MKIINKSSRELSHEIVKAFCEKNNLDVINKILDEYNLRISIIEMKNGECNYTITDRKGV